LIHISELSNRFVKNPGEVVKVHQKVMVTVLNVDLARRRISLSMKDGQGVQKKETQQEEKPKRDEKQKREEKFSNQPFLEALREKKR
jgi:protein Tex